MQVYFIRHGKAQERGPHWGDRDRPLTEPGAQEMARISARLMALGVRFDRLLSSPLARARQTAEVLQKAGLAPGLDIVSFLEPGGRFPEVAAFLADCAPEETVALVGHLPDLPEFAETLLWGRATGCLVMKKGSIIGVSVPSGDTPAGQGALFWLTPPRLLCGP